VSPRRPVVTVGLSNATRRAARGSCERINNLIRRSTDKGAKTREEQQLFFLSVFFDFAPLRETLLLFQEVFHTFWGAGVPGCRASPALQVCGHWAVLYYIVGASRDGAASPARRVGWKA
jgi:hypothetical protein